MTTVADGLYQYGGQPVGTGARYTGWWGVQSWFVDYDHGNNGYTGKTPTKAKKDLQEVIDVASAGDVIYIRNRDQDVTSTDPEYITPADTNNWSTVEATHPHLSIIGASNVSHIPTQEGQIAVYLRGSTSTSNSVLTVNSPFILLENLAFHRGSSDAGHVKLNGNSTSLRALGACINNCLFRMDTSAYGGVYNIDNWFTTVYGCTFHDCDFGVNHVGSSSTIRRNTIAKCWFRNQTAASCTANIQLSGSSSQNNYIVDCIFGPETPTGGTAKFINVTAAATGIVSGCQFPIDTNEGTTSMEINGMDAIACWQAVTTTAADPTWGLAT